MGLILWPAAILAFVLWSFAAWLIYAMSDWLAELLAGGLGGVLPQELATWAQWLSTSLGDIIQVVVVVMWGLVGLLILSAPVLLRRARQRHALAMPASGMAEGRDGDRNFAYWRGDDWRNAPQYQGRRGRARAEIEELRYVARDMVDSYRKKRKWKKKDKDWDD